MRHVTRHSGEKGVKRKLLKRHRLSVQSNKTLFLKSANVLIPHVKIVRTLSLLHCELDETSGLERGPRLRIQTMGSSIDCERILRLASG